MANNQNSQDKLAGRLYLDLTKLQQDIVDANRHLAEIGKNVAPQLSSQIEKAIKDGIQNGVKNANVPKLPTNTNKGSSNSSAYTKASRALKEQATLEAKLASINKELLSAAGQRADKLRDAKGLIEEELRKTKERFRDAHALVTNQQEQNRLVSQGNILKAKLSQYDAQQLKAQEALIQKEQERSLLAKTYERIQNAITTSLTMMAVNMTVNSVKKFWSDAWEYATQYYDRMNEIQIVTLKSQEEADKMSDRFRNMAHEMSVSSNEIAEAATIFYRQGLDDGQVEERLQATIQYAKTAGVEAENAANKITSVVNSISKDARGVEMSAQRVADVFLYLGDNAASSGEEIGTAMQRSAALADTAGVSFEMLGAMIATVSERTRQDAGTIGTALNAIMSRLTSVKQKGFNEEDETKINDVAKALSRVNVQLTDGQGQWRRIEDIFMDVAKVWDTLDDKTQNYLATVMAGVRQQNVFRNLMADMSQVTEGNSRVMELYEGALNSAGTAAEKYSVYAESVTAAHDRMAASMEKLYSLFDANIMKGIYNAGSSIAESIYSLFGGEDTHSYTSAIATMTEQQNVIQGTIEKYSKLKEELDKLTVGSAEYNAKAKEMDDVVQSLANQYAPFAEKVEQVGGKFSSADEAIKAMNDALREQMDILYIYQGMEIGKQITAAVDAYYTAVRQLDITKQSSGVQDLFKSLGGMLGYEDVNILKESEMQNLVQQMREGVKQVTARELAHYINGIDMRQEGDSPFLRALIDWMYDDQDNYQSEAASALTEFLDGFKDDYRKAWEEFRVDTSYTAEKIVDQTQKDILDQFIQSAHNTSLYDSLSSEMRKVFDFALKQEFSKMDWGGDIFQQGNGFVESVVKRFEENKAAMQVALQNVFDYQKTATFNPDSEDDLAALQTLIREYEKYFEIIFGRKLTGDEWVALQAPMLERTKNAAQEAQSQVEKYYATVSARRKAAEYDAKKEGGFVEEMNSLELWAKKGAWKTITGVFSSMDSTMFDDITKKYTWLVTALDEIDQGHYGEAFRMISEGMKEVGKASKDMTDAEKAIKKLNEEAQKAYGQEQNNAAKKNGYGDQKASLLSYWGADGFDANGFAEELGKLSQSGMLQGIYDTFPGLEAAYGAYVNGIDGASDKMKAILENETDAWAEYKKKVKEALAAEITEREGKDLATRIKSVIDTQETNLRRKIMIEHELQSMTQAERNWVSANIDGIDELITNEGSLKENTERITASILKLFQGSAKQAETFSERLKKINQSQAYDANRQSGFKNERNTIQGMIDNRRGNPLQWLEMHDAAVGGKLLEDMTSDVKGLGLALDALRDGNYDLFVTRWTKAWEDYDNSLKDTDKTLEKIKESSKEAYVKRGAQAAEAAGYSAQRSQLLGLFGRNDRLGEIMTQNFSKSNADLLARPMVDAAKLAEAGWKDVGDGIATVFSSSYEVFNKEGKGFEIAVSPILPNGEVLSPEGLNDYIDWLEEQDDFVAADADTANGGKGLLLHWFGLDDVSVEAARERMGNLMEILHQMQESYYLGGMNQTADEGSLFKELTKMEEEGTLQGLYNEFPMLEEAIGLYQTDAVAGSKAIVQALTEESASWQQYLEQVRASLRSEITDEEGADIAKRLSEAFTGGGREGLVGVMSTLSEAEKKWASSHIDHLDEVIARTGDATEEAEGLRAAFVKIDAQNRASHGEIWEKTAQYLDDAKQGGDAFFDTVAKLVGEVDDFTAAQTALNAIQSGQLTPNTDAYNEALQTLSSYTGIASAYMIDNLDLAAQMLSGDMELAGNSVGYLAQWLFNTANIQFDSTTWRMELAKLAVSADETKSRMANLILTMLDLDGSQLVAGADGSITVDWGGRNYQQKPTRDRSGSGSGSGRSSSSSSNKDNKKTISEIQRLVDLMDQVTDLFKYHQSMIQQIQSIYSGKGEYTNLIHVYEEEIAALKERQTVLQGNIEKIEPLLEAQQELVAGMSTSDEDYQQASEDLKRLQEAHQKYKKELLENVEALDELEKKIKEAQDAIRQLEIDLENEILQAIKDREAKQKRMLEGRIEMENTILDLIKRRYEIERDEILDATNQRIASLERESDELEKQLDLRNKMADQEDKQTKLQQLQEKLIRISADPTRQKEAQALQKEIAQLREEMAWEAAEEEVKAQQDAIEQQVDSLEDYVDYVEQYYEDLFDHPQKLIAEMKEVIAGTDEEIMAWLAANSEEYANATEATQEKMRTDWQETLNDMRGITETHWEEVYDIISQGDEAIIAFLTENRDDFINGSVHQQEQYLDKWKELCDNIEKAYADTYEAIQQYDYSTIPIPDLQYTGGSSSGGSDTGGGGGGGGDNPPPQTPKVRGWKASWRSAGDIPQGSISSSTSSDDARSKAKSYIDKLVSMLISQNPELKKMYQGYGSTAKSSISISTYKKGGLVNYTGPAWVDGSPNEPEAFLSAKQTQVIGDFAKLLERIVAPTFPSSLGYEMNGGDDNHVTIETINVNVEKLDSDADYEEIAARVGEVLVRSISRTSSVGGIRM